MLVRTVRHVCQARTYATQCSESAARARAEIDKYFSIKDLWRDPWTPCLTDHPPGVRELDGAVDWSVNGNNVINACNSLIMPKERWEEAMEVRRRIESVLKEVMTEQNLQLFTFGSCMSGLGTAQSDLDLVIMRCDNSGRSLNANTREEQLSHLEDYYKMLSQNGFDNMKVIQARGPILRREWPTGVNFDISLFFHGVRNSLLLREYARSCPFFMPMSIVLREWGKYIGVCNSAAGYLTPYCLNIMIIKYLVEEASNDFMVPIPPLLPPIYYPTAPSQYFPLPREVQRREALFVKDLGMHIAGFLRYYACYHWADNVISAGTPLVDSRQDNPLWKGNQSDVIIEEMFSQQDKSLPIPNMGHKIDSMRLLSIQENLIFSYFHAVHHNYLPADPEDRQSPPWRPGMNRS